MLEKLNWFCLIDLRTLVLLMWKWMGLFLRNNHLLRCLVWLSLLNWIGALTLSLLLKLAPRKLEPWFNLWSFFLLRLLYISINLPHGLAWNTVVMLGIVLLVATCNCCISYKNGPWSFTCCLSWTLDSRRNVAILSFFYIGITLVDVHLNWLNWFHFLILEGGPLVILIDCMNFLSP